MVYDQGAYFYKMFLRSTSRAYSSLNCDYDDCLFSYLDVEEQRFDF